MAMLRVRLLKAILIMHEIFSSDLDAVDPSSQVECPHCSLRYCSAACRDEGWRRYHQLLCLGPSAQDEIHPSNMLDEIWRNSHFPPETASVHLITRIIAMVRREYWS